MRARKHVVAVTCLALLAISRRAGAQATEPKIDTERFKPAVTHDGWVNAEGSDVRYPEDRWEFGAFVNYGRNELIVVDPNGNVAQRFESGRLGFDVLASVTLADPFAIGLDLPFFLLQTGDSSPSFAGLGDLRLVPKLRILDDKRAMGIAIAAELRAPTHLGDYSGGARNVVFWPKLIVDHRFGDGGFRIGGNAGVLLREGTKYYNINAASEFTGAFDIGYRFGGYDGKVEIGGEANGALGLVELNKEEAPLEGFFYVKINPSDEWEFEFGPGVGLFPGYGVPVMRGFFGIRWTPTAHDKDHDGVPDDRDKCPDVPENRNGYQDMDGCPEEEADDDHDGVPNSKDQCPNAKETINGFQDDDGCPDTGDPRVIYEKGEVRVLDNVKFETGSAKIKPESYSLLDQVALTIKANPDIKKVHVEGHTDETGSHDMNMRLSKQRAEAVKRYLIQKGVSPSRLDAEGYGPDRPLVKGTDPASRAKNRRVEFKVED